MIIGYIMLVIGILFIIPTLSCLAAWICFKFFPNTTARTGGWLKKTKHKKNVTLYEIRYHRVWHKTGFLKDLTKAKYEYTVKNKRYYINDDSIGTPRQTQKLVSVVYIKKFPRFAYIASGFLEHSVFFIYFLVFLFNTFIWILYGIQIILH